MDRDKRPPGGLIEFKWFGVEQPKTLSLPEQIASRLGDRIVGGDVEAGSRIIEQDIAKEFAVSRGPIREALRILEREGLVRISPRRGATATLLTADEVKDIFEIRAGLYRIVAARNAEMRSPQLLADFAGTLDELRLHASDPDGGDAYAMAVFRLSLTTARAAGNVRLTEMITSLALQTYRYSRLGLRTRERRQRSLRLWRDAFAAMKKGDVGAVTDLAVRRIQESRDEALRQLKAEADDVKSQAA